MKILEDALVKNERYFSMLALMASLSNLSSESEIPFIHYRITENLFCKYLGAENLSRTDTAYDAKWNDIGIGIKTFTLPNQSSKEKIAEFNALSPVLRVLEGMDLAMKLAEFRNERMMIANSLYNIKASLYHIIGRRKESLCIFNSPYDFIDKDHLRVLKSNNKGIHFTDGKHNYSFNKSKSVLMKEFKLPDKAHFIPVNIIKDPFELLESLLVKEADMELAKPKDRVLLPLFSEKMGIKYIPKKSGLNQWNAAGRKRDHNEIYIPIPASVYRYHPDFFPDRNKIFTLILPDGSEMKAKVCQDGGKALMSNPNKALGEWFLRKVLHKMPDQLVTYMDLIVAGFDSLIITKISQEKYRIDVSRDESFIY